MKIILPLCLFLMSLPALAQSDSKIELLERNTKREHTEREQRTSLNLRLGLTHLTDEDNDSEDLLNADFEARYALAKWVGVNFGVGKWFDLDGGPVSENSRLLSSQANVGLTFALSGSLIRTEHFYTDYTTKVYKKGNKFLVKNERLETVEYGKFDGFRLTLNGIQAEINKRDIPVYGGGVGVYYEGLMKRHTVGTWQLGVRYDHLNNSRVNANLIQAFVGFGFMP